MTGTGKRTVRLPVPHKPGRYRVYAVLADRALARDETSKAASAEKAGDGVRATLRVEVVVTK